MQTQMYVCLLQNTDKFGGKKNSIMDLKQNLNAI